MKLVFLGYVSSPEYDQPHAWLYRINGYTGILESLGADHEVTGIERINYEGACVQKRVHYYFMKLKEKTVRFPGKLHRLVKGLEPDVVFVNGCSYPLQVIQLRLKLGRSAKIFLIHRSERPLKGIKKYLQKLACTCVNGYLFTSSEFGTQWMEQGNINDAEKIYEVMHGSSCYQPADKSIARQQLAVQGAPVFLWVGRLEANKDPLTVVKGFIKFLEIQPSATLYMIYQTEELLSAIKEMIGQQEKARKAIHFVGRMDHEQLQLWYNAADFLISGSHYEGGGMAVCEAMSCGCIPVLTDIIAFRRMTGPGRCGLLYRAGDAASLLSVLHQTISMDLKEESSGAINYFQEELSFNAIARKINKIITPNS